MATPNRYYNQNVLETVRQLGSHVDRGLDSAEAAKRLASDGPNALPAAIKTPLWKVFGRQFADSMVLLLIAATLISFALGDVVEAVAISAIVLLNALIGFVQERQADAALDELRKLSAPGAIAQRDNTRQPIRATDLVAGDIIFLEAGNYVPADAQLIQSANLQLNEAALTGESMQADKQAVAVVASNAPIAERENMVFSGTLVTRGRGRAIVTTTGLKTEIGLIAKLITAIVEEPTPLQRKLNRLGKLLSLAALAICGVVLLAQLARTTNLASITSNGVLSYLRTESALINQAFILAVSLAVAAVPEGLSAIVTINLALGMRAMVKQHALVRRLSAVETLGSTTIICSDKTGTMTQNAMMVVRAYVGSKLYRIGGQHYDPAGKFWELAPDVAESLRDPHAPEQSALRDLLRAGLLCSDALIEKVENTFRMTGDPTEGALVAAAAKAGFERGAAKAAAPRIFEIPFDAERKMMTTIHRENGACFAVVKGAPEVVIPRCTAYLDGGKDSNGGATAERPCPPEMQQVLLAMTTQLGEQALRVLAVARKRLDCPANGAVPQSFDESGLTFIGLLGMIDPPRTEVAAAIRMAHEAGVRTLMITGDNPITASAIARDVGILEKLPNQKPAPEDVLQGPDIDVLSDEALTMRLQTTSVFARVSPQHKLRLVNALRRAGHIVAMTGDGVNDAPALKQADIGIAMGLAGTDVSKQVADIVLTDDNFASIVNALGQGRVIYANIRKFVAYLLGCNAAEILIILVATLLGWPSPLSAIQLLWLNLVTDGAPALALGLEPAEPDVMQQPPRAPSEPILNRRTVFNLGVQSLALAAVVLVAYAIARTVAPEQANTLAFLTLALSELPLAYASRSETHSMFQIGLLRNRMMQIATLSSVVLVLAAVYVPFVAVFFNTVPVSLAQLGAVALVALIPAGVVEGVKFVERFILRRRVLRPCSVHWRRWSIFINT